MLYRNQSNEMCCNSIDMNIDRNFGKLSDLVTKILVNHFHCQNTMSKLWPRLLAVHKKIQGHI